jgi:hypothetical protein
VHKDGSGHWVLLGHVLIGGGARKREDKHNKELGSGLSAFDLGLGVGLGLGLCNSGLGWHCDFGAQDLEY